MNYETTLIGLSIYLLIWEKLPEWGTWFMWIINRLPRPLAYLYEAWRCPYCFGFWIALALHWLTGFGTIPELKHIPSLSGDYTKYIAYFLDALAAATLILVSRLILMAISGPAIDGYRKKEEFMNSMKNSLQD